jgi:hypothetical protein
LTEGSKVRVTTALTPGCVPGDAGTVVLATVLGDGRVLYHVQLDSVPVGGAKCVRRPDPARAGGMKCFYQHEIEQAG